MDVLPLPQTIPMSRNITWYDDLRGAPNLNNSQDVFRVRYVQPRVMTKSKRQGRISGCLEEPCWASWEGLDGHGPWFLPLLSWSVCPRVVSFRLESCVRFSCHISVGCLKSDEDLVTEPGKLKFACFPKNVVDVCRRLAFVSVCV